MQPQPTVRVIKGNQVKQNNYEKKAIRVAAYCRVSTDVDEQLNSFASQKAYYKEKLNLIPNGYLLTYMLMKLLLVLRLMFVKDSKE